MSAETAARNATPAATHAHAFAASALQDRGPSSALNVQPLPEGTPDRVSRTAPSNRKTRSATNSPFGDDDTMSTVTS